jgi:hypothetical protein
MIRGVAYDNGLDPMRFIIDPDIEPANADFSLTITTSDPPDTFETVHRINLGGSEVLIVDDDGSELIHGRKDHSEFYIDALESLNVPYTYWNVATQGVPGADQLTFDKIVWFTGDTGSVLISQEEIEFLENYMNGRGNLYLTGQDIAQSLSISGNSSFIQDYLKTRYVGSTLELDALGAAGNVVGDGMRLQLIGSDGAQNQLSMDELEIVDPSAEEAFGYLISPHSAAITYSAPDTYRLVFFGFGFEGIRSNASGRNTREEAMQKVLDFLDGNTATPVEQEEVAQVVLPSTFELHQNYPNPFNPSTVISFTVGDRIASKPAKLDVYNVLGQRVIGLLEGRVDPGVNKVEFDAGDLSSGVYFYRLQIGAESLTRKMMLIR